MFDKKDIETDHAIVQNFKDRAQINDDLKRLRDNRIEALRAASRVVAQHIHDIPGQLDYEAATLDLAEQFARWLETGER